MTDDEVERQPIDVINFALLSFLSEGPKKAKNLQDLLDQYTEIELSRTPLFRRMRGLVESGFVREEKVDAFGTAIYSLTENGWGFCVSWAVTIRALAGLSLNTLESIQKEEYGHETK